MTRLWKLFNRRQVGQWVVWVAMSWLLLRPALLITVSLDDFINPFFIYDRYGPSLSGPVFSMMADVPRTGHFNYLGMAVGGATYWLWAHLIAMGVRYSLIFAITKFVVFLATALITARLVRRILDAVLGISVSVWTTRFVVAGVLFTSLQIHVPWSLDPVGSFPLSGYAAVAVGLLAVDRVLEALLRPTRANVAIGALMVVLSILYYEINVAVIAASVPLLVIVPRATAADRRQACRLILQLFAPAIVITVVLQQHAARINQGYTGTELSRDLGGIRTFVVAMLGSVPGAAWITARDWLGQPVSIFLTACLALGALLLLATTIGSRDHLWRRSERTAILPTVAALACPLLLWTAATAVQAATVKVSAEAIRVGHVYNYYAYGSVGVAMIVVMATVPLASTRWFIRARPIVLSAALLFATVQLTLNDTLAREYNRRFDPSAAVLVAFSEQWDEASRCQALRRWDELPYWQPYYRDALRNGMNALYLDTHDELFCAATP
jgi:hypothetical protein